MFLFFKKHGFTPNAKRDKWTRIDERFIDQFENNGLYPKLSTDAIKSQIGFYQMGSGIIPGDSNFYNTNFCIAFKF